MNNIVLDKSFLVGVSGDRIKELSQNNTFFMPLSLLYELVKDEPKKRASLFRKFDENKKYLLLPSFSCFYEEEIKNNRPITELKDYLLQRDYSLYNDLCNENFNLSQQQCDAINEQKEDKKVLVNILFCLIEKYIEQKKSITKEAMEHEVIFNQEKLTQDYKQLQKFYNKNIPDRSNFNSKWFIYKWLQVFNIFSIDIAYRYDSITTIRNSTKAKEKIEHDIIDMEYLLFAIVEGNFAVKEKKLIKWFKLLCPNGKLYEK